MTIQDQERATYREMFAVEQYSDFSPGERYADLFAAMAAPGSSVLDAGCGTGKGMAALEAKGYRVIGCDLILDGCTRTENVLSACLWRDLEPVRYIAHCMGLGEKFDYVYCCDVLEHVPPTFTMLVVRNLLAVATHRVFLSISLVPDQFGVWVGKPLHQTVQGFEAWRDQLNEVGRVVDARDLMSTGIYFVEPRR